MGSLDSTFKVVFYIWKGVVLSIRKLGKGCSLLIWERSVLYLERSDVRCSLLGKGVVFSIDKGHSVTL